jgi:mono/diheme cytochrome c family protein
MEITGEGLSMRLKIGSFIFFIATLAFSGIVASAAEIDVDSIKNPVKGDKSNIMEGMTLYMDHCAVCHGDKADGNGASADGFEVRPWSFVDDTIKDLSDGFLFQQIKNGGTWFEMPPWSLAISDKEIWTIINYLRSLNKGGA